MQAGSCGRTLTVYGAAGVVGYREVSQGKEKRKAYFLAVLKRARDIPKRGKTELQTRTYDRPSLRQSSTAAMFKEAEIVTGVLTPFRQNRAHIFSRLVVVGVKAERTVCDASLSRRMRGTKCSCRHSPFRGSRAQGAICEQIGQRFSALRLAGRLSQRLHTTPAGCCEEASFIKNTGSQFSGRETAGDD
jgi:hypothetical protein